MKISDDPIKDFMFKNHLDLGRMEGLARALCREENTGRGKSKEEIQKIVDDKWRGYVEFGMRAIHYLLSINAINCEAIFHGSGEE